MATTTTNFIGVLGAGSGIDIKALAQSLVDAEKQPKVEVINKRITQSEAKISGYSTVSYAVSQLQRALEALKSSSDFNAYTPASTLPNAVSVRVTGSTAQATHEVSVQQLAASQRSVSGSFSAGQALNGSPGSPFSLQFTIAGTPVPAITVNTPTPEGVVSAINNANLKVKASLVNSGAGANPWRIVLQGESGAANSFSLTSTATVDLGFTFSAPGSSTLPNRLAQDALATVNGLSITRSTNQISDAIDGVTLDLLASTGASAATLTLARDTTPVKTKIKAVVDSYNDLQAILDSAMDKESKVENLGGTLVGDTTARSIRSMVKQIVMPDTNAANTSDPYTNLRQLGLFIDSDNQMKFFSIKQTASVGESLLNVGDESVLDKALAERFEDVASFFSGGTGGIGKAKEMADRLAGTGAYTDSSVAPSSPIRLLSVQQRNAGARISADKERLTALEDRMSGLLSKYIEQFSVMESIVGQSKSTRTGIENSFKGMSASR